MNDTLPKKIIVTKEAMAKIVAWLEDGKEVHQFVCQDLGCLASYFSPLPAIDCQRHAWKCPCSIHCQSVLSDALELEPLTPGHEAGTPYKWEIISLDVWGNKDDGWDVNQAFHTRKMIELPEEFADKDVRDALVGAGYLKKTCQTRHLEIDGDDQVIYVNQAKDDYPLYQLFMEDR